jgi:hypothetical protein
MYLRILSSLYSINLFLYIHRYVWMYLNVNASIYLHIYTQTYRQHLRFNSQIYTYLSYIVYKSVIYPYDTQIIIYIYIYVYIYIYIYVYIYTSYMGFALNLSKIYKILQNENVRLKWTHICMYYTYIIMVLLHIYYHYYITKLSYWSKICSNETVSQ